MEKKLRQRRCSQYRHILTVQLHGEVVRDLSAGRDDHAFGRFEVGDVAEVADDDVGVGFGGQHLAGVRGRQRDDAARAGPPCRLDARLGVFEDDAFGRCESECGRRRQVDFRIGFAARHHVAVDFGVEKGFDVALLKHEIDIGPAPRRTYGAAYARIAEFVEQGDQSRHGFDFGSVDFAVDGLLLVAKRRSSLLADHLFGHDEPHDIVVAPAESPSQFLLPAAHAVAVAEDFERPDVDRRIGHERTVHVEYGAFYHMIPYFKPQR